MKKKATILLMGLLTVAIFNGCGNKDTSKDISVADTAMSETQSEQEYETVNEEQEEVNVGDNTQGFALSGYKYESDMNGFYIVSIDGLPLYGMVNSKGDFVIPAEYDEMQFAQNGNVLLKLEGKWGVFDTDGEQVLPFEYDVISAGIDDYYVQKAGMPMIIDAQGNMIKELDADAVYDKMEGDLYLRELSDEYAYCSLNGNENERWVEYIDTAKLYRIYKWDLENDSWEKVDILDKDGNLLYELSNRKDEESYTVYVLNSSKICAIGEIPFGGASTNQVASSDDCKEYHLYNMETKERSEQEYLKVRSFGKDKIYGEKEDGIDVFDTEGNLISSFELSGCDKFVQVGDMFYAQYGSTYRIYNEYGKDVTDERYLDVSGQHAGFKFVRVQNLSGQWGVLDKNGKEILPFGSVDDYSWYNGSEIISDSIVNDKWYILTEEVDGTLRLNIVDYNNL